VREHEYMELMELGAGPRAPSAARGRLEDALAGHDPETVATAALLVSELVSNAVRHASSAADRVGVVLGLLEGRLRIEVVDAGDGFDVAVEREATDGFGLRIIDDLADAWGVEPGPPHKVWCEMAVRSG
jgi:two-component sensor histidine kinase